MRSCKVQGCCTPPERTKRGWYCDEHHQAVLLRELVEADRATLSDLIPEEGRARLRAIAT